MKALNTLLLIGVLFTLSACGGGDDSKGNPPKDKSQPVTKTGVFLDSPVENIGYRTETITNGITNDKGEYNYLEGETVTFFIGDLDFPPVTATGIVTPLELADTQDTSDATVVNIIRLLQSLDQDGDPDNGITITDLAKNAATQVSFDVSESEFESSVANLMASSGSPNTALITEEQAIAHFEETLENKVKPSGELLGVWEFSADNVIFMFLPNNRYLVIKWEDANNSIGFERGTYTIDKSIITFTTIQNNDGRALICSKPKNVACSGDVILEYSIAPNGIMTLTDPIEAGTAATFEKFALAAGELQGVWEVQNGPVIFMYLPDNRYFAIQWEQDQNFIGFERGTYTNDTSKITFTTLQNNDGEALICNEPESVTCSNEVFDFSISNNILTFNNPLETKDDPVSFNKVF